MGIIASTSSRKHTPTNSPRLDKLINFFPLDQRYSTPHLDGSGVVGTFKHLYFEMLPKVLGIGCGQKKKKTRAQPDTIIIERVQINPIINHRTKIFLELLTDSTVELGQREGMFLNSREWSIFSAGNAAAEK